MRAIKLLLPLLLGGCATVQFDHGRAYVRFENLKQFAVTNDRSPKEPVAVILQRHTATLTAKYNF